MLRIFKSYNWKITLTLNHSTLLLIFKFHADKDKKCQKILSISHTPHRNGHRNTQGNVQSMYQKKMKILGHKGIWTRDDQTRVGYACLPTTETSYESMHKSSMQLIMKICQKSEDFRKIPEKFLTTNFWCLVLNNFWWWKNEKKRPTLQKVSKWNCHIVFIQ